MSQIFPSENQLATPINLNPTIFSVGRPVGGASTNNLLVTDPQGNLASIGIGSLNGYGIQPLDSTLTALAGLNSSPGLLVQTGQDTFTKRELTGITSQIFVTNGNGQNANPQIGLDTNITIQGQFRLPNIPVNSVLFEDAQGITTGFANFGFNGQAAVLGQNSINNFSRLTLVGIDTTSTNFAMRVFPATGSAILTVRNDGVTTHLGQLIASNTSGNSIYALTVQHLGGTVSRNGLYVNTSGSSANTNALLVQTGSNASALIIDGAGNTGIGTGITLPTTRLRIGSAASSSSTFAVLISNAENTTLFSLRNDGAFAFRGGTVAIPSTYTVTNPTVNRSINVTGITTGQVAQVLGTLISDLQARGILG